MRHPGIGHGISFKLAVNGLLAVQIAALAKRSGSSPSRLKHGLAGNERLLTPAHESLAEDFLVLCVKFCKGGHGWLEVMRLGGAGFSCAL